MALYKTRPGESPTTIARRFGISRDALIRLNSHKPTQVVRGQTTWRSISSGEGIRVPAGVSGTVGMAGALGDASMAAAAISALMGAGGPCLQANAGYVCAIQAALGLTMDGKYGNDTSGAARRIIPSAPGACSPAPLWWGARGSSKCPATIPSFPSVMLPTPVMTPMPSFPTPLPTMPVATVPSVATAVQALATGIDPCLQVNAPMICAAQAALGLTVDGKYGPGTAAAVRALVPGAPPACATAPLWWGARGSVQCSGGGGGGIAPQPLPVMPIPVAPPPAPVAIPVPVAPPPPPPPPPPPLPPPPAPVAVPVPIPPPPSVTPPGAVVVGPIQPDVVAPEKGKLSTGAIVAGAVGLAALVGIVALAASGKSRSTTTKTTTIRRAAPRRKVKRKPAKRKPASRKKKR